MNQEGQDISFSHAWLEGKLTDEQVGQLTPEQLEK